MATHPVNPVRRRDRWVLLALIALVVAITIASYLLFDWASGKSVWFIRVALVLVVTVLAYRIGQLVGKRPVASRGQNWIAIGHALAALLLAGYFGMIHPAIKDRDRDRSFQRWLAEGQAATEALEAATRATPESDVKPMSWEIREQIVNALRRAIDWMDRYQAEEDRYTLEQRRQLHEEFRRMSKASADAREKIARWTEAVKNKIK
jgi:hypothetical protein